MTTAEDFGSEFQRHIPEMRAYARSLQRDVPAAEDLLHDALLAAWSSRHTLHTASGLRPWLYTIVRNTFYSAQRRRGAWTRAQTALTAEETLSASTPGIDLADLRRAFAQLPATQREALILVCALGHSYEEAALEARCPVGTIRSRVNRGRARLGELLDAPA